MARWHSPPAVDEARLGYEIAMPPRKLLIAAAGVSLVVHCVILVGFALIRYGLIDREQILIETVFSDERQQEEFSQELDLNTEVAESLNLVAGGAITGAVGATTAPAISQTRIETSESLKEPTLVANIREFSMPSESLLGDDLGEKAVMGETGAVVEGYGAALSRLTREILRMMRESKVTVVWLFDESESMEDDQKEIRDQIHKVYEELGIAAKREESTGNRRSRANRLQDEILLTSIVGFGEKVHYLLEPSADLEEIKGAIDKIEIDRSGKEYTCAAIREVVSKYKLSAGRQDRRLVIVVVTDESGDDGQYVEEALQEAKRANAPIYILGRESVFGYPYAHQRWTDDKFGLTFWLRINRGPETPFPEALQWDGFRARDDAYQSGFGPYEQVRLVKETGGVFFMLPGDEENLVGREAHDRRKFDLLQMKEYEPKLESRREYEESRARSPFRTNIARVIANLNPHLDKQLSIRREHYPADPSKFREDGKEAFDKALYAMGKANIAIALLEQTGQLREREESWRWRAAYDLAYAQVLAYRVRLFQYLLTLDQHVKQMPPIKNPKNNVWNIRHIQKLLPPDPEQVKVTRIDLEEIEKQMEKAKELYRYVINEHPGTPWARRAQQELDWGFGISFVEGYWDPRHYDRSILDQIQLPSL